MKHSFISTRIYQQAENSPEASFTPLKSDHSVHQPTYCGNDPAYHR